MYTFDGYNDMQEELMKIPSNRTIVLYLPRNESKGPLAILFDSLFIQRFPVAFYCGPGRPSKWPSFNCEPMYEASDVTDLGYQVGSLACLARVIAARYIGNGCRVEWLNEWRCFPDDTNYLNVREENIFFQTRDEYDHETYREWDLEQMKDKWKRESAWPKKS